MKIYTRLISMGLVLVLLLGTLSSCGKPGAEHTAPPEETPSVSVAPTLTPEPVLTPTPEPEPSPEPVEPTYDVFNDPNVLWGEFQRFYAYKVHLEDCSSAVVTSRLEETLAIATGEHLIAFEMESKGGYATSFYNQIYPNNIAPIDVNRLNMPELLNPSNVLRKMVESMEDYTQTQDVKHYLTTFYGLYVSATSGEMRELILDEFYEREAWRESSPEQDRIRHDIFKEFMEEDEYFRDLHDRHARYLSIFNEFWYSWCAQQYEYIRAWMIDRGFIPVYTLDQAHEAAQIAKSRFCCMYHDEIDSFGWYETDPFYHFHVAAMTFVGTKQQIEDLIAYSNQQLFGCILKSAEKPTSLLPQE